jgi:hypothetical protein
VPPMCLSIALSVCKSRLQEVDAQIFSEGSTMIWGLRHRRKVEHSSPQNFEKAQGDLLKVHIK